MIAGFRKIIAIPQDHGSWVFLLSPMALGFFAGPGLSPASGWLILTALAAFLIRQPLTILVKAETGRRPPEDRPLARFWVLVYGGIGLLGLAGLIREGFGFLTYLAAPGLPIFAWHLLLVSRREERKQAAVETLATGVLALAAPAAYWVGLGGYDPAGWWLWALAWAQAAASILHAYLRLKQRDMTHAPGSQQAWIMGRAAFTSTTVNLIATGLLGGLGVLPGAVFLPFLVQWLETVWGMFHPAIGWKPSRIGVRQLGVSALWTFLFILCWRWSWMS